MEEVWIEAEDGLKLSASVYDKENPIALIQIIHGAKEHKGRYHPFASYLQKQGFAVIVSDNRGHGKSINDAYPFGFMDGAWEVVDDQVQVTRYIQDRYPEKELYLFGHSLGSLFARMYLQEHDHEIDKLVLSGTANYIPGVSLGILLGKAIMRLKGKHGYSKVLSVLGGIEKEDLSWISVNEENREAIRNDPLYVKRYPNASHVTVFEADRELHRFNHFRCQHPELKILSVSGEGDPVTGSAKGLRNSLDSLKRVGYRHIRNQVYAGMNHEILNESNKKLVYEDIVRFLLEK